MVTRLSLSLAVTAVLAALAPSAHAALSVQLGGARPAATAPGSGYQVGIASRTINPGPDGSFAGKPVYLGGYGLGAGPILKGRPATGVLGEGVSVRAFAVTDGSKPFAIADIETQGCFAKLRSGPWGLADMRKEVERRTGGALRAHQVVIQCDHSHSGPDMMGVWGGVPDEYQAYVARQAVDAIVEAFETRRPGTLVYGSAPGRDLLSNQFDYDAANHAVDSDVRVLQARDAEGRPFATLLNFSAHTTVLGSGNTKASGDWVQRVNPMLEQRLGGKVMTVVATLGRTQPADRSCADPAKSGDARELCTLDAYAARVADRAADAMAAAAPLGGPPVVAATSYLVTDPATNPLLLGLLYGGLPLGVPINRAITAPWMTANLIGTVTASARIGDVLLSSGPGEMYPQIAEKVRTIVPARGHMTAGLANDQLGYLIAPYEAYPEPIRRSFFNQRGDEVSPIDNDNYFFNVSHTMGERVTCSLLRGAGEVFGQGSRFRDAYDRCLPFLNDAVLGPGSDVEPLVRITGSVG